MANHIVSAEPATREPLDAMAGAVQTAIRAARDGAADARESVAQAMPAVNRFLSRFVYTTAYSLSYGVVFPTMLLVHAVPKDNALVHGLIDGGHAAKEAVERLRSGSAMPDDSADSERNGATED
jgi:hypothetical protein